MIKCHKCGYENSDYSIYCQGCGSVLTSLKEADDYSSIIDSVTGDHTDTEPSDSYTYNEPDPVINGTETTSGYEPQPQSTYEPEFELEPQVQPQTQTQTQSQYQAQYQQPNREVNTDQYDPYCVAGLVLSFIPFCAIFPIVAIILSAMGLNRIKVSGQKGRGLAIAGILIAIAGMMLSLIITVSSNININ